MNKAVSVTFTPERRGDVMLAPVSLGLSHSALAGRAPRRAQMGELLDKAGKEMQVHSRADFPSPSWTSPNNFGRLGGTNTSVNQCEGRAD